MSLESNGTFMTDDDVVIVDYECMSSLATTIEDTWSRLVNGESGIRQITRFDAEHEGWLSISDVCYAGQIPLSFYSLPDHRASLQRIRNPRCMQYPV